MIVQKSPRSEEIFVSQNIHAFAKIFNRDKPICILFSNAADPQSSFSSPLMAHEINFVFVACRNADWWQYSELPEAERAIYEFVKFFPKRITCGSSMGAYGALICSKSLGADVVLALSPQAVMRSNKSLDDRRWESDRVRIQNEFGFPHDDMASRLTQTGELIILHDPRDFDRQHVAFIDRFRSSKKLYFPLAGHFTTIRLNELGMLSQLVREVVGGHFCCVKFQNNLHLNRKPFKAAWLAKRLKARGKRIWPDLAARIIAAEHSVECEQLRMLLFVLLDAGKPATLQQAVLRIFRETDYTKSELMLDDCKKFAKPLVEASLHGEVVAALEIIADAPENVAVVYPLLAAAFLMFHAGDQRASLAYAFRAADRITAWHPSNAIIAEFMELIGQPQMASVYQARLPYSEATDFRTLRKMAARYQQRQDWHQVMEIWTQAIRKGTDPKRVAYELANALFKLGKYDDALITLRPLVQSAGVASSTWKLLGRCAQQVSDTATAANAFGNAIRSDPTDASAHRLLSDTLIILGDVEKAHKHAKVAKYLKPDLSNAKHLEHLGKLCEIHRMTQ